MTDAGHMSDCTLLIVGGLMRASCTITQFYIPSPQVAVTECTIWRGGEWVRPHMKYHKWHSGKCFILQVTTKSFRAPLRANSCLQPLICRWLLQYSYMCPLVLGAFAGFLCFSLEDLALVEGFTHVFEVSLPHKVLVYHSFALLTVGIHLAPLVRFVVNSPVRGQLEGKKQNGLFLSEEKLDLAQ